MSSGPLSGKLSQHLSAQALGLQSVAGAGPQAARVPEVQVFALEFRGHAGAYARLWLVNIALCVVTLGLYLPWARVRLRQYLYQHTFLQGYSFHYDASPRALLLGYLLVGGLFWLFTLSSNLEETRWLSAVLIGLFVLLHPLFLYRSVRFQARNTVYRGLRFGFQGTGLEAYALYGLLPLTYSLTLGLTAPLTQHLQRSYLGSNLSYGQARGRFEGNVGQVYLMFFWAFLVSMVLGVGWVALWIALLGYSASGGLQGLKGWPLLVGGLLVGLGWWMLRETVHSTMLKYLLERTQLGPLRLRVRFKPLALAWVTVSSMLVQLLTLGLATPWALMRKTGFMLSHIDVLSAQPLTEYRAAASREEGALGEAATELFDIGLGL